MKYLGIFNAGLPRASNRDICLLKLTSEVCDRYQLIRWKEEDEAWYQLDPWKPHGVIEHWHKKSWYQGAKVTTFFSTYSRSRSFTRWNQTLDQAVNLLITNYLRHAYREEGDDLLSYYKGIGYFNTILKDGRYVSGYVRPNGKLYVRNSWGQSIVSGAKVKPEEIKDVIESVVRLKQAA